MIMIDGKAFAIGIASLERGEQTEYKYSLITESGHRRMEIRAKYRIYTLRIGSIRQSEYDDLVSRITAGGAVHTVSLPDGQSMESIEAEIELGGDALCFVELDGTKRWDNLTLTVKGVNPL